MTGRAKAKPKPVAAATSSQSIVIELEVMEPKKHSIKFLTDNEDSPINGIYLANRWHAVLGRPGKIKVTIEPAE